MNAILSYDLSSEEDERAFRVGREGPKFLYELEGFREYLRLKRKNPDWDSAALDDIWREFHERFGDLV